MKTLRMNVGRYATAKLLVTMLCFVAALAIIGCKQDEPTPQLQPQPTVPSELRGTWKLSAETLVITANLFTLNSDGGSFSINILSFSTENNTYDSTKAEYPSGYKLVGKVISATGNFASQTAYEIGKDFSYFFFLNTAKNKFVVNNSISAYEKM
jgi:hypothetical protein